MQIHYKSYERSENKHTAIHNSRHYFITIRKSQVKDYVDFNKLLHVWQALCSALQIIGSTPSFSVFDLDNYGSLHLHLIAQIPTFFKYKDHRQMSGYHIDYKRISTLRDFNKVHDYILSKGHAMENKVAEHIYTHKFAPNLFISPKDSRQAKTKR